MARMDKQRLVVQTRNHLRGAGGRGLSVAQLQTLTGWDGKRAQKAIGRLWTEGACWRWYCKRRLCFVYTESGVHLDADCQLLHSR